MSGEVLVKENKLSAGPLSWPWLAAGLLASAAALWAVALIDDALPAPLARGSPPERFIAEIAHEHLVNLTSIGPRVAGSYENEVLAVGVLVAALKQIAAQASPHNRVEIDVQRASGAFSLSFMDGMNNVYRDVQSVVARVSAAGAAARAARPARTALLLNCHFDTVPDSPGASDDGAGCAVLLETLRALAAARRPLRHDAVFLFNGAEENILQASHAFVTQHPWARAARAFVNLEACGAGGREVLFQAGPHDPWIVEVYASVVPHPFASSLAQELFESGLIPADTDFRIFRDFGNLSGVDLAWSANGYVYHTRLDTAERVPPAALQRTGDNVLALALGLLEHPAAESEPDPAERQPVFFDVLGAAVVSLRAPGAALAAAATAALVLLKLQLSARAARRALFVAPGAWRRGVLRAAGAALAAGAAGVLAAAGVALLLHAAGARLAFYSRPLLLAPLYALPALATSWRLAAALGRPPAPLGAAGGWWRARLWHDALAALAAAALLACAARGLRSGFLPLLWALLPAAADVAAGPLGVPRPLAWALGAALPLLQTWYLVLGSLLMFVPVMGRAGAGPLPPDVTMAVISSTLILAALSWLLPFVVATRNPGRLIWCMFATSGVAAALAAGTSLGAAYSAARPQRLMVFHTRRTQHSAAGAAVDTFYWVPELDANTPRALREHAGPARELSAAECARWPYCGAPYFLPVLALVGRSHRVEAPAPPLPRLEARVWAEREARGRRVHVHVARGAPHAVLVLRAAGGARVTWSSVLAAPRAAAWAGAGGEERTYFFALHAARAPHDWRVELLVEGEGGVQASLAAHAMFGRDKLQAEHARLLAALPPVVAATGWGVDLHLYDL
ncbi:endoplasmic reticulum metallopeptidase 1-like isoform X2 [Anticarsia gemmatalis]|uniref:endoplasmic reticulum metallopeptidase 1-like isoform X2 n=1 Tax=Anticarsia gemmatalis TaxID=129554 RepID=UPI003F77348A